MQRTRLVNEGYNSSQFSQNSLGGYHRPFYSQSQPPYTQPFPGAQMMMSPSFPLNFSSSQPQSSSVVCPPEMVGMYNFFPSSQQPLNTAVPTPSQLHTEQPLSTQSKSKSEQKPPRRSQRAAATKKKCAVEANQCCGQDADGCGKGVSVARNGKQRARGRPAKSAAIPIGRTTNCVPTKNQKRTRRAKNTTGEKEVVTNAENPITASPPLFSQPVERIFAHPSGGPSVADLACTLAQCHAMLERMLAAQQNLLSRQHKLERHLGLQDIPQLSLPAKVSAAPTQDENVSHGVVAQVAAMEIVEDRENGRELAEEDSGSEYLDLEEGFPRGDNGVADGLSQHSGESARNPLAEICLSNETAEDERLMSSLDDF